MGERKIGTNKKKGGLKRGGVKRAGVAKYCTVLPIDIPILHSNIKSQSAYS